MQATSTQTDPEIIKRTLAAIGQPKETVYSPREDSFLLLQALSNIELNHIDVCDVGTGSGILGLFCAQKGASVTVTDIDESALTQTQSAAKQLGIDVKTIHSNLFSQVTEKFDLILFNPPYLPSERNLDYAVDGGADGVELTRRFLSELPFHLKPKGLSLLLLSSLNQPEKLVQEHPQFSFSTIARKSIFFEELQVLRLTLRQDFASGQRFDG